MTYQHNDRKDHSSHKYHHSEQDIWCILSDDPLSIALIGAVSAFLILMTMGAMGALEGFVVRDNYWGQNQAIARLIMIALSGGFGFILGWFFSPKAGVLHVFIYGAIAGCLAYLLFFDYAVLGWGAAMLASCMAFFIGFGYWAKRFVKRLQENPTTFGSAAWASLRDLFKGDVVGEYGLRLGYFHEAGVTVPIHYTGDQHALTVAPTRLHKGTSTIIPNLLTYQGSVMVVDPKGENALVTAKCRQKMGQKTYVVDPWGITGMKSARFNPLDWLQAGDLDISDNAMLLAEAIIVAMGENEQFWTEEAKALLLGIMLLVATDPYYKSARHLGTVRDLFLLDGEELKKLFKRMLASPLHMVRSTGARCLQKEEKLLSNVMASVQAQTHFLDSPRLRESLSASDFDFADLKEKQISIYLVLPADRLKSHGRWLRLLIQQALTINARNIEKKPAKPILFILDEMPALGRLTMVEQAFSLMAGFGMQLHGVVQDLSQLKTIYGDGWETFISNAGVIQYFGSRDRMTAEYFSALCGVTTVWNFSTAIARAIGITRSTRDTSNSETNTNTDTATGTQRNLAYADELMRLTKDRQLLLINRMNPILGLKKQWFENDDLKDLGVNIYANETVEPSESDQESDDDPTTLDNA